MITFSFSFFLLHTCLDFLHRRIQPYFTSLCCVPPDLFISFFIFSLSYTLSVQISNNSIINSLSIFRVKTEGSGCAFILETEDLDAAISKAIAAGAVAEGEVSEVEGSGRVGKVKDPYGYLWMISSVAKKSADVEA